MHSGKAVKFVVQKCDTHLNDVVSADTAPAHVLALAHTTAHNPIDGRLHKSCRDSPTCLLPDAVIDQRIQIGSEVAHHRHEPTTGMASLPLHIRDSCLAKLEHSVKPVTELSPPCSFTGSHQAAKAHEHIVELECRAVGFEPPTGQWCNGLIDITKHSPDAISIKYPHAVEWKIGCGVHKIEGTVRQHANFARIPIAAVFKEPGHLDL